MIPLRKRGMALLSVLIVLFFSNTALAAEKGRFQLEEATIASIHAAMRAGDLTCRDLVKMYLDRIEAYDRKGPKINSVIEVNPDALTIADSLDAKFAKGGFTGPLHGIPVILKDNYDTADKMTTTAGSRVMEGFIATKDAFLVKKLRDAGAIILGKGNMDEWAHGGERSGYSSRWGQTLNPYKLNRVPLGSSGGPAAAVAANFAVIGMGTDTFGSIRNPSAGNCLVGIKPTRGLTGRSGIVPFSLNYDVAGPMIRTVADAAITLGVLTGIDPKDPHTFDSVGKVHKDYMPFLKSDGLKGSRLGVLRFYSGKNEDVDKAFNASIEIMKKGGATIVDPVHLPEEVLTNLADIYATISDLDFKWHLAEYLATHGGKAPVKTLSEVIAISKILAYTQSPVDKTVFERIKKAEERGPLTDPFYLRTLEYGPAMVKNAILKILNDHHLDAIIFPTNSCPPRPVHSIKDPDYKCGSGLVNQGGLASHSGFPQIFCPAGFTTDGLPVSISFLGPAYSEPILLRLAYSYEQGTRHRRPPKSAPPLK